MHFELKAIREGEGVLALAIEAADEADAIRQAKSQGLSILTIKAKKSWQGLKFKPRKRFALALFSQELLALLNAGLSLVEAIEALAEKEHQPDIQKLFKQLIATLYEGRTLSYALQQFPVYFPILYVATVRASETTGDLAVALARYVAYQEQMDSVRKKIISASIYPVLLLVAGGLVTLFLIGYVVPKFSLVYDQMGRDLPLFSRLLMNMGHTLRNNGMLIASIATMVMVGGGYALTRPATKLRVMQKIWQIPAVGSRMKIYQLARFYRTLGMLLQGGTAIVTALKMTADLLPGTLRSQLILASDSIREGASISQAMERHGLTTAVAARMLTVGERTGQMGEMMDRIAAFHDEEMARWVEWFSKLFEPILMAVIGLVIGIIVVLMYFPIFELAGSIQ